MPRYSKELKLEVVREIVEYGKTVAQAASDFHLKRRTVADWHAQYQTFGDRAFDRVRRVQPIDWKGLALGAIGLLVALSIVIIIKAFVLGGSHDLFMTRSGISQLEISVLSLILAPFVIKEVLIIARVLPHASRLSHMRPSLQEFMMPLAALSASILIYAASIKILNLP